MSDGYRDDGTGTEDWGVTRITDQIAAWSERRNGLDFYADRLRTTAEALRHYGQHEYGCASEHGRFKTRCDCGYLAILAALAKDGFA